MRDSHRPNITQMGYSFAFRKDRTAGPPQTQRFFVT